MGAKTLFPTILTLALASGSTIAQHAYDAGASDSEIKIVDAKSTSSATMMPRLVIN
jgi:hypothetical protein